MQARKVSKVLGAVLALCTAASALTLTASAEYDAVTFEFNDYNSNIYGGGGGVELNAIGGAIIGGTSMSGGSGTIAGTILGVFIMSILQTGLPKVGLQANYQQIIIGVVLLVAVYIDVLKNKKLS